jgi:hypothetical protein
VLNFQAIPILTGSSYKKLGVTAVCGLHNLSEEYSIWISPSVAVSGSSWPVSLFSGDSTVCTMDAEGPAACRTEVFITKEADGVGDKGSGDTQQSMYRLPDFGSTCSTVELSGFEKYQFLDSRHSTRYI